MYRAPQQPQFTEYELMKTSSSVCISCIFLDGSTTGCVAVVHRQISQLSSSGLMNIESSHKFTRSGDTAYGCIEGVNLEQYQVGVVWERRTITTAHRMWQYSVIKYLRHFHIKIKLKYYFLQLQVQNCHLV